MNYLFLGILLTLGQVPGSMVSVKNQPLVDDIVVIERVEYAEPGWIVIHNDINGEPGEIVGIQRLFPGITEIISINLDLSLVTDTLYAMLHQDLGLVGKWELTKDFPVVVNGSVVAPPFVLSERLNSGIGTVEVNSGDVSVDEVISGGPGWLVIESKGKILGRTGLAHGRNTAVSVPYEGDLPFDAYLRLYRDGGVIGEFDKETDFPTIHEHVLVVSSESGLSSVNGGSSTSVSTSVGRLNLGLLWMVALVLRRFHRRV